MLLLTSDEPKTVHVKFVLHKECLFGQRFLMVGNEAMFGLWEPKKAVPMEWSDGHIWTVELVRFIFTLCLVATLSSKICEMVCLVGLGCGF